MHTLFGVRVSVGIGFVKYQMLVAMNDANRLVVAKSMAERCIELLASLDIHACLVASLLLSALSLSLSLSFTLSLCVLPLIWLFWLSFFVWFWYDGVVVASVVIYSLLCYVTASTQIAIKKCCHACFPLFDAHTNTPHTRLKTKKQWKMKK